MKKLIISEEERNRILNQYDNSMIVDTSKFKKLLESELGNVKPLLNEDKKLPKYENLNEDDGIFASAKEDMKRAGRVPFKNNEQGNKFRSWVNKTYPNIAASLKLDPIGTQMDSYYNDYITKAYNHKIDNQTLGYKYFFTTPKSELSSTTRTEVPFKNNEQGNKFRAWVNEKYPEIAKRIDLDKKGLYADSYNNDYITRAFNYKIGNDTLGYKFYSQNLLTPWMKDSNTKSTDDYQTDTKNKAPKCVSIGVGGQDWCPQISTGVGVTIAAGKEDVGCSRFARECLDDYRAGLRFGDAWDAINNLGDWLGFSQGKLKYNMYNDLDWDKIYDLIKKNNITKSMCEKYFTKSATDGNNPTINNMIKNSGIIPSSSSISSSSLELGDFVGIYYPYSKSMGHAFCQKLKQKGIDNNSNVSNKSPFTFNTHIGFVGAMKNGEPIIFHQTYDKYRASPAKIMLNKNSSDGMIAWVRQNPTVSSKTKKLMDK